MCNTAARTNGIVLMERLLTAGISPNAADYDCRTALHLGAAVGNLEIVKILVQFGAKIGFQDRWGVDALMEAVKHKQSNVAKFLIEAGANVNTEDLSKCNSMYHAIFAGTDDCITLLRDAKAHIGEAKLGELMCSAGSSGDAIMLQKLLRTNANPDVCDYDRRTGLHLAAAEGHLSAVRVLVEAGASLRFKDRWGVDALTDAVKHMHDEVVLFLIQAGSLVNSEDNEGRTVMYHAVFSGTDASIAHLQNAGGIIPQANQGALVCTACSTDNRPLLRRFLSARVSPDSCDYDRRTGLHLGAAEGHLEVAKLLVDGGATLDFKDRWGVSALMEAVKHKQTAVVEYLVKGQFISLTFGLCCSSLMRQSLIALPPCGRTAGADIQTTDNDERSVVQHAVSGGNDQCLSLLIEAGAKLGRGRTVAELMCRTASAGDDALLARLLYAGAHPDTADYDQRTALHLSAAEGRLSTVTLLVEKGATPLFKDRWGHTALDKANSHGKQEVMEYLKRQSGLG